MSLSFDPTKITFPSGHFVGGKLINDQPKIPLYRPSDGVEFAGSPIADANMVDQAVQTAKQALKTSGWGQCQPRERTIVLQKWADLIIDNGQELAQLETVPSTRLISQLIQGDIAVTAEQIRFFAELADKEGGALLPTSESTMGMSITEPYGVVGAITPWNFPISMAGWKLGPALAAGNAVVLKPSEMTPFTTIRMAELAIEAGVPEGLINIVLGDGPTTGNAMTGHPDIAKVSFTGSTVTGQAIMENIARSGVKPMTLELGGKSPQVVFADADLDLAARCIASAITYNAGQACVTGSRIIVHADVEAQLIERLIPLMSNFTPGPAWNENTDYNPIISEKQLARLETLVQQSVAQGAELCLGGERYDTPGYFYKPTLLTGLDQNNVAIREEIFGPVLSLQTFNDFQEAMMLADHPVYGLCAGVYTQDLSTALNATKHIEAGTVWVNRYGRSRDHILPTGGYKSSGIGKDLGREAYHANRRSKTVLIDHQFS
tara:strand:- start:20618 stop:22090 length:1473 start_codon:yes stop_codon:yes gene_type:complete